MTTKGYECPKCGGYRHYTGEIRATGGFWQKIFNVQNRKFVSVSCKKCGYTEFYDQGQGRTAENILDFLTN